MSDLHTKYRPKKWSEVLGQDDVIKGLRAAIKKRTNHAFILTGDSGCGKTTLARIFAYSVGCTPENIVEVDAATNTGIDAMRQISIEANYKSFGDSPTKVIIIDEAHSLSKQAFQSLLKPIEEPAPHIFWILCTTEPAKIPKTIQTRCSVFALQLVDVDFIIDLLARVVEEEEFATPREVLSLIARQSFGSPRRALTYLAQCYSCQNTKEVLPLLQKADEDGDAIILAKALVKGNLSWARAMKIMESLQDQNAESIRLVTLAYMAKVTLGVKDEKTAARCLTIIDSFSDPYNSSEGVAPLLLSLGRIIMGGS